MVHYGHFNIYACTHLAAAVEGTKPSLKKNKTDTCTVQGPCYDQERAIPKELAGLSPTNSSPTKENRARKGKEHDREQGASISSQLEGGKEFGGLS